VIQYGQALPSDLPAIAELYQDAFPEALLAVFGRPRLPTVLVVDALTGVYESDPEAFGVAKEGDSLAGFIIMASDRRRLGKDLFFGGTLRRLAFRWVTGRYPGLGAAWTLRLARLVLDYLRAEKTPNFPNPMAQVLSIVVSPASQRRGIGRRLTELALDHLRQARIPSVRLEVDAAKTAPVHLYRKMGFQEAGRLPTPRGPALVMILAL
jgi:ribosomal protein S18 acetylase RimI-like enzyme